MAPSKVNLAGRISHFFAINRPLSILLLFVVLVFGLASFFLTPKQYNPEIIRPAFVVSVSYDGATVDQAVNLVVHELVEKVLMVPGVEDVYTEVDDGSVISTTVIFAVGYDAVKAKLDLFSQLEQHSYLAQGNISKPSLLEINPETIPIIQLVFGSEELTISELRKQVVLLARELGNVPEVSELKVYGGYPPALVVEADPGQLNAVGVTLAELQTTLAESQLRSVAPVLRAGTYVIEAEFNAVVDSPEDIGNLEIKNGVRVRDVASTYEGVAGNRSYVWHRSQQQNGEAVMLSVAKREGASAPAVAKSVISELDKIIEQPEFVGLSYQIVGNDGVKAQAEIVGLTQNLITSVFIVAMVLFLFLSIRAALVVLVAIPVTLLTVFGFGYLFDQTINRITLFALILSLGLLVDSAIVATENIYEHLRRWRARPSQETKEQVIANAVDEVGVGLLLSTITSVIVFLPMNYITGMMGPYMGPIAFFVPVALIVSFLVAIVLTPFIASYLLDAEEKTNQLSSHFGKIMDWVTYHYEVILRSILLHRYRQRWLLRSALLVFLVALMLPVFALVHFQMLPKANMDQFYVYLDLPVGTDTEETKSITALVADKILADKDVLSVQEFVSTPPAVDFNGMFKGADSRRQSEQATLRINLVSAKERQRSSTDIATNLRADLKRDLPTIASAVRVLEEPPGPPVQATFVAEISATNQGERDLATADLASFINKINGVVDVYESLDEPAVRARYQFNHQVATQQGVTAEAVANTLSLLGSGLVVSEYVGGEGVEYTSLILRLPEEYSDSPETIDSLSVTNQFGEAVSLRTVLALEQTPRPGVTHFKDAREVAYVTAEIEGRSIVYVVIEVINRLIKGELVGYDVKDWNLFGMELVGPDGFPITFTWGGEWEMTLENFRDLGIAMGVALFMVYALLVAQYRAFNTPAYILVTVPLGLIGILSGFFLLDYFFGIYLTATALIGFIALIGIVVNNAIIYLEYVEQLRVAGESHHESLILAGKARLRPILLTSLTTVLGSLTIAGDPVWSGLAWAIVFGLSLSTVLTLIIYPTLLARFVVKNHN